MREELLRGELADAAVAAARDIERRIGAVAAEARG
jgi:hypothetical protein